MRIHSITTYTIPSHANAFELPGRSPGVLLLHGFTGDPSEMRSLAQRLNIELGLYCYAPLLPGHGVPPHELYGVTDDHWLEAARHGLAQVKAQHKRVIVCAFSMGAALAAIMLAAKPQQADAFIAIAPMIATRIPLLPILTPLLGRMIPWVYPLKFMSIDALGMRQKLLDFDPTLDLDDPQIAARLRDEVRIPVTVIEELRKVAARAIHAAPHIEIPTLVAQGDSDMLVDPDGAHRFYRSLAAQDKTLLT
ncbi:MAG: alpha/beta fold hydrolase, partial [Chloroflexota bacterium]